LSKFEPIVAGMTPVTMEGMVESIGEGPSARAGLVARAVAGDRESFARLVEPELRAALGAALILLRSRADAADAVQDALLAAWQGLDRLRDPVAFPAWFRTHVVRAAMRGMRGRRVVELDAAPLPYIPADALDRALDQRLLGRAFDRLATDDRVLLTLRFLWDAPVAEVAAILRIPQGTVKSRTHAALARLRAACDAEARR
jgi:RNA polymerase sigma-70 factor, ECF subfamily